MTNKIQPQSQPQIQSQPQPQPQQEGHNIADEEMSLDLLLHCWNLAQEQVQRAIDFNKNAGVKYPDAYVGYGFAAGTTEPMDVKQKKRWWAQCTHKKSGNFITLDSLSSAGKISDYEKELFEGQKLPRREMISMVRIKVDNKGEYLHRIEQWVGLNEIGGVITVSINGELDYTRRVGINPDTAKLEDGTETKILKVGTTEFSWYTLPKIYTTRFTKENVLAALEKAPPSMADGRRGKISYILKKEGTTNTISASNQEEFINGNFDEIWNYHMTPQPQINISGKELTNYLKQDAAAKEKHQYQ